MFNFYWNYDRIIPIKILRRLLWKQIHLLVLTLFWSYSGIVLLLAPVIMFMMAVGAAAATEDSDVTLGTLTGISIILLLV